MAEPYEFKLPKLGMQMSEGTIAKWLVPDGSVVEEKQPVAWIETDKVESELEAPVGGTIRIMVAAGETVEVGTVIATFAS
jgi:2-oxoglutarate dehydrogenase E2 component (dihydrolipoamide succinyltransferase)